jgi:ParB family chromosome partitioning protein
MQQQQQQESIIVSATQIMANKRFRNPRRRQNPAFMSELKESIKAQGLLQPILVRPVEDGMFELVAGFTRFEIMLEVFGNDCQIPALCREMSDEEAESAALTENTQRQSMSPADEALSAARMVGYANGDRDEAAKRLGWTRAMLDRRMALMNCAGAVLDALTEEKIILGHAEILAAVEKTRQEGILTKILAVNPLPTVADLKTMLEQSARNLADAIFDKAECVECPHNSSKQRSMFSEAISEGRCTHAKCFEQKTEAVLEAKKTELGATYQTVRIVRPGEDFTLLKLVADGPAGVGEEQAKACRTCANFGAAVSGVPGKLGKVYTDQCFDAGCNSKKVAARIKAERQATESAPATSAQPAAGGGPKKAEKASAPEKAGPVAANPKTLRGPIIEYRQKVWRRVYRDVMLANPETARKTLLAICMARLGSKIDGGNVGKAFKKVAGNEAGHLFKDALEAALSVTGDATEKLIDCLSAAAFETLEVRDVVEALRQLGVKLEDHFRIDAEFMDVLTKVEIEAVAEEIGLKAHMGDAWKKAVGGKKDEIIKSLLNVEGFEYQGKVPAMLALQS